MTLRLKKAHTNTCQQKYLQGAAAALAGNRRLLENEFRRITDYALVCMKHMF